MASSHLWIDSWSVTHAAVTVSAILLLYILGIATHRMFFSQYAKFPGPKLAGLTYGYMFYYDQIAGNGQYYKKIEQLHDEYGTSRNLIRLKTLFHPPPIHF